MRSGLALILDMDGVVIDSNPLHRSAWATYCRRFGIETDAAMLEWMYGRHNAEIVRDFFGAHLSDAEVTAHGAAKENLFREMAGASLEKHLVPGVRDFLSQCQESPIALATNGEPPNVEFLLDNARIRGYFRVVVDGGQIIRPKPDPEIYITVARRLNTLPANCIVFEDSYAGITAARAAGMRTVGLRTTHRELPGVDLAIDDFRSGELQEWLRRQSVAA
jgi:beta-phosphoglucomutase